VDLRFDRVGVRLAFGEAFDAVLSVHARRDRLDTAIIEMAVTSPFPRSWTACVACAGSAR
jgi:hypothetical protein